MAVVERKTRLGMRYTAVYRTVDGTQKSAGTFGTRKEAEAAYWDAAVKVSKGIDPSLPQITVYPTTVGGKITVEAFADHWLPEHARLKPLEPHTQRSYETMLHAHIIPRWGSTPISNLTTREVALWLRELEKQSATVAVKVKAILSKMCQAAAEMSPPLLTANPVRGIELKKVAKKRRKALTHDQYEKLLTEIPEHWHLMTDLITGSGVRWEEAQALKKSDLEGDVLWVGAVLNELRKPARWIYQSRTKTGKERQVVLGPALVKQIQERLDGFLFLMPGREHQGRCTGECSERAHIHNDYFRKSIWRPALEAIGLDTTNGIVPRDMRRSHATWLRANGAPLEIVQQQLGHTLLTTTIGYLAETPDAARKAAGYVNW
ncbi:MAG: tyrosine-type recombinase/integrase [Streptosporangiaceae bacterium]